MAAWGTRLIVCQLLCLAMTALFMIHEADAFCAIHSYTYKVTRDYLNTSTGQVIECWGSVTVRVCAGRCETGEIADYRAPFKISSHQVCRYAGESTRMVRLQHCPPDHPDPYTFVIDARACECSTCNSAHTYCTTHSYMPPR
nr:glycoprotein beta-5 [Urechis unicinctus]